MKYKNFKEYQQSDEYALHLLNSSDGAWQYHPIINFGNGTWYCVKKQNGLLHGYREWGHIFNGTDILDLLAFANLYRGRSGSHGEYLKITEEEFQTRLNLLSIGQYE